MSSLESKSTFMNVKEPQVWSTVEEDRCKKRLEMDLEVFKFHAWDVLLLNKTKDSTPSFFPLFYMAY